MGLGFRVLDSQGVEQQLTVQRLSIWLKRFHELYRVAGNS